MECKKVPFRKICNVKNFLKQVNLVTIINAAKNTNENIHLNYIHIDYIENIKKKSKNIKKYLLS